MVPAARDKMITIRMSEEEVAMIHAVARHHGLSLSDVVRQFVRHAFREMFGEQKAKAKR